MSIALAIHCSYRAGREHALPLRTPFVLPSLIDQGQPKTEHAPAKQQPNDADTV
jgi:hypothetical protein